MKRIAWILAALALALVATPAFAQEDTVTLTFELAVTGDCPDDATFFGLYGVPASEFQALQLTDTDGDGVFTGSAEVEAGEQVVQVQMGIGTQETTFGTFPGEPTTLIWDYGTITVNQDTLLTPTFDCGTDDDQQDDDQDDQQDTPNGMPETGAGGMAGGLPLSSVAAMLSLITAGGYFALRRR